MRLRMSFPSATLTASSSAADGLARSGLSFSSTAERGATPVFLRGNLVVEGAPCDTFLKLDGFTKGFVTVNGFNIGRYFNPAGPQKTLYVPAPLLREGDNAIIVFESDGYEEALVELVDKSI